MVFTTRKLIAADAGFVRGFVAATVHGYEDTLKDPQRSLSDLERANPTLPRKLTAASLQVYLPLFANGEGVAFGTLQATNVEAMSKWMVAAGLIRAPVTPARYGANRFIP